MSTLHLELLVYGWLTFNTAGTRQVVTGLAELRRQGAKVLCTSMCIGSGMGGASIFVNEAQPL